MYEEGERQFNVLFRIYKDGDLYSMPIQCITWVEPLVGKANRSSTFPQSHDRSVSVTWKKISA